MPSGGDENGSASEERRRRRLGAGVDGDDDGSASGGDEWLGFVGCAGLQTGRQDGAAGRQRRSSAPTNEPLVFGCSLCRVRS